MAAYHSYGDPAYKQLCELFEVKAGNQQMEATLIVLSDSVDSRDNVCDAPIKNGRVAERGEGSSPNKFSLARRKLMFDDGGPQDLESTNRKPDCYFIPAANGIMEIVEEKYTGRVLPRETPPRSPSLAYSCASSKPVNWFRMPRKPDI